MPGIEHGWMILCALVGGGTGSWLIHLLMRGSLKAKFNLEEESRNRLAHLKDANDRCRSLEKSLAAVREDRDSLETELDSVKENLKSIIRLSQDCFTEDFTAGNPERD